MTIFYFYLILINLLSLAAMAQDKRLARSRRNRIPESVLLTLAFIGGSIGALLGMLLFRHKTKHLKFTLLLPCFLLLHILLALLLAGVLPL